MPTVPSFVRSFQRSFDRTITGFAVAQRRRALALDRRLSTPVDLTLATLKNGKRLRPLLVSIGYEAAGGKSAATVMPAGLAVELFHTSALIHDDIMDRATGRRGVPTVEHAVARQSGNSHAGLGTAILSGDLFLAAADQFDRIVLPTSRRERARQAYRTMAEETILGQQLEFDLSRSKHVSLEDIVRTMVYKSGRYSIEWPLTIGAILGGAKPAQLKSYSSFSVPLGMAFQLRDDILSTFGNPEETGKSRDSDIREGKRTLLVYFTHERATAAERRLLWRVLGDQRASSKKIAVVRMLMKRTSALARAQELTRALTDVGLQAIRRSAMKPDAKKKMDALARYLLDRTN